MEENSSGARAGGCAKDIRGFGGGMAMPVEEGETVTIGILLVTLSSLVVFEISGYTLLSFVSSVLLLLLTTLILAAI